jgi:gas vesicle protein
MSERGNFAVGLILGGMVGAALGILLAPTSGHETRENLWRKGEQLRDRAREHAAIVADDVADRLRTHADDVMTRTRAMAGDVIDGGRTVVGELSGHLLDAVESGQETMLGR